MTTLDSYWRAADEPGTVQRDPSKWVRANWYEAHTGEAFGIATHGNGGDGLVRVKTFGEVIEEYRVHPESKSIGPDQRPCGHQT